MFIEVKKSFIIFSVFILVLAISTTVLVACNNYNDSNNKTPYLPQSENDRIITFIKDNNDNDLYNNDEVIEAELPPESFVGTIIDETTAYMIVEPNRDEKEFKDLGERITVNYLHDHIDYLYGQGRRVVITYIPDSYESPSPIITTDDIRTDGFEDFSLSVQYRNDSIPARFAEIAYAGVLTYVANNNDFHKYSSDYKLYYYNLHDVYVTVDGDTLTLKEALTYGKVTLDGIIAECNRLASLGIIKETDYKDGGSSMFDFGDFRIIKYHTLDGDRDVYIGSADMDINAKNAKNVCVGVCLLKDLGLKLEVKDVTVDGATVVFRQSGGNATGELQTGEAFYLERKNVNIWVPVSTRPLIDYAFHMIAYMLNKDGTTELKTEWKWLYDSLPEGQYRIAKEVMDFRQPGDYDEYIYYAYFEITDTQQVT